MKTKLSVLFLTACFTLLSICTKAQTTASDKQAMAMLKEFYTAYMTELGSSESSEKKLDLMKKKYCTTKFIGRIPKLANQIDADPVIKAQDGSSEWPKTLSIKPDPKKPNQYNVSYTDGVSPITLHVSVIQQSGKYMIDNVW